MTTKKQFVQIAKLMERERELREQIRALTAKVFEGGRFSCHERQGNNVTLHISLADLMAINPEAKAEFKTFPCEDGSTKGYFVYGPEHVGEIRPGFYVWVKHETKSVIVQEAKPSTIAEAA
jgi:hypothetical protein